MQHQEFSFKYNKYVLFGQYWMPEDCKTIVLLVHGMGEHSSRYTDHVIPAFLEKKLAVITYDNFGHGKSSGKRGHCPNYNALMEVLEILYRKAKEIDKDLPIFLYGHSMGGNLVINYVLRNTPEINGAVLTSPFLRLAFTPPAWKMRLGKVLYKLAPFITLSSGLDVKTILRLDTEIEKYKNDPWIHDKISPNFSFPIMEAGVWAMDQAATLETPVLVVHGTADQITDHKASEEFARRSEFVDFIGFEGGYHELHKDLEKEKLLVTITSWIRGKIE